MMTLLPSNSKSSLLSSALCLCTISSLISGAHGFASGGRSIAVSPVPTLHSAHHTRQFALHSTLADNDNKINPLGGVAAFEEWFSSSAGAQVNSVRHALFHSDSLRGLEFTSSKASDLNRVAVVPRKLVLSVPFSGEIEEDPTTKSWDTNLSCKLWEECQKGKDSVYYG